MAKTRYKRLPGKGPRKRGFLGSPFSRCSLYLGDDHVLAVDNNGYSEDYKRFYFSDIQAVITRKTRRGTVWNIILAFMIASSAAGALFVEGEPLRNFSWILSGAFLAFFLINLFRGPTCICHIMTAVQEDQLPSLNRLRVAHRVIAILRLAIEKAQGALSPEEANTDPSEVMAHPTRSLRSLRRSQGREQEIRHYDGTIHMIAFAFMLADGVLTGIDLLSHSPAMGAVSSAMALIYFVCIIMALARQHDSDIPGTARRITWASLCFILVSYCLSYGLMVQMVPTLMAQRPRQMITQWDITRAMLDLSPQDSLFLMAVSVFSAVCSLTLGTLGLIRVKKHRGHSASVCGRGQNRNTLAF